jgi:predicted dehydrogenase
MRLALAGLGGWGRNWAQLVTQTPGFDLVAAIDPSSEARKWAVEHLDIDADQVYDDLGGALQVADAEAVMVLTPPDLHRATAETALAAGKHVLVEKPAAMTIPDAQAIAEAADRAGKIAMVSQNYRYSRPARAIRQAILGGEIGDLLSLRLQFRWDMRTHLPAGDFRFQMPDPLLFDMSIHHFDLLRALTGQEAVAVDAHAWNVGDTPFEHPASAFALITLENGAVLSYDGDWATHRENLPWSGEWEIIGSEGRIFWDGTGRDGEATTIAIRRWDGRNTRIELDETGEDSRVPTLETFKQAIETGTEPESSVRDNLRSLALVLATAASSERHQPIELSEILEDLAVSSSR